MRLARFITENTQAILTEWDSFAKTLLPAAEGMSTLALRDHAKQILEAIARDIQTEQSPEQQYWKSRGETPSLLGEESAAAIHGTLRQADGFTLLQLTAEFRALRACVLRLWLPRVGQVTDESTADMLRFNEAIDQALAESASKYSIQVNRTRDMFLAILGHDLRAPLAAMSLSGEYLKTPNFPMERVQEIGERVERNAATMATMVNDLLGYSRTQLGSKIPINVHPVDIADICRSAVSDVNAMYPASTFSLTTSGGLMGTADFARLHQVFSNLLINAAHYGAKDHPIHIAATGESGSLVVQVKNQGTIIPSSSLQSIFNPLVQLAKGHESDHRPATSLGLGLFIAREITEAHDGTIAVESSEMEGTTFTVRLPREPAHKAPAGSAS